MTRGRWTALALLAATFAAGLLAGAGASAWARRGDDGPRGGRYLERMTREVGLSAAQRDTIGAVLDRYDPVMDSLWRTVAPQFQDVRERIRSEIRTHLTEAQQRKYAEMLERMDAERSRRGRR